MTEVRCSASEHTLSASSTCVGCASLPAEHLLDEAHDGPFWARGVQRKCDESQCMHQGQELHPCTGQVLHSLGVLGQGARP